MWIVELTVGTIEYTYAYDEASESYNLIYIILCAHIGADRIDESSDWFSQLALLQLISNNNRIVADRIQLSK